jgi:hypothetical protein
VAAPPGSVSPCAAGAGRRAEERVLRPVGLLAPWPASRMGRASARPAKASLARLLPGSADPGMWHAHRPGRQDWSTVLWNILMFSELAGSLRHGDDPAGPLQQLSPNPDQARCPACSSRPLRRASDRSVPLKRLACRIGSVGTPTP